MRAIRDDCNLVENNLALWVGGDLDAELRSRVDQHLSHCERCGETARSLGEARRALISRLQTEETSAPDLWPAIGEALRREGRLAPRVDSPATAIPDLQPSLDPHLASVRVARRTVGHRAQLWTRFGVSAAAAALLGFMLGRMASDSPPPHRSQPELSANIQSASGDGAHVSDAPSLGVVSVSRGATLRRLAPGEPRLSDGAVNLPEEQYFSIGGQLGNRGNPNVGSPASLQNVSGR